MANGILGVRALESNNLKKNMYHLQISFPLVSLNVWFYSSNTPVND